MSISTFDVAGGADVSLLSVAVSAADAGTASSSASVGPSATDAAAATNVTGLAATVMTSGAGTAADTASLASALTATSTGTAGEAASLTSPIAVDTGVASDGATTSSTPATSDAGSAASSPTVAAAATSTDAGSASESVTGIFPTASDSGTASATTSIISTGSGVVATEVGLATPTITLAATLIGSDSGLGTDAYISFLTASDAGVVAATYDLAVLATDVGVAAPSAALSVAVGAAPPNSIGSVSYADLTALPHGDDFSWAVYDGAHSIYLANFGVFMRYDINANTFVTGLAQPAGATSQNYGAGVAWINGKLYRFGGNTSNPGVQRYDPGTNAWTTLRTLPVTPTPNAYEQYQWSVVKAVIGSDGHVYLWDTDVRDLLGTFERSSNIWRYDPVAETVTLLLNVSADSGGPVRAGVVADDRGRIWSIGGWWFADPTATAAYYDIATNTFNATRTGLDPTATEGPAVAYVDGAIYVFGGDNNTSEEASSAVRCYDTANDVWALLDPLALARSDIFSAQVAGSVYLFGGWQDQSHGFADTTSTTRVDVALPAPPLEPSPGADSASFNEGASVLPDIGGASSNPATSPSTRWAFIDPSGVVAPYVFEVNPNKMSDPTSKKSTRSAGVSPISTKVRGYRSDRLSPREWTFSGVTISEAQQDAFYQWYQLGHKLWLRDHFDRVWEIRLTNFDQQPRKPSAHNQLWRFQYTFTASVYRRMA